MLQNQFAKITSAQTLLRDQLIANIVAAYKQSSRPRISRVKKRATRRALQTAQRRVGKGPCLADAAH
ncbi:hypothetical protein BRAS3843_2220010 [Bradyrhizobium sp. STM 3843]|nr:hypothetical protein BRAS3843_2220010 [Bradyrhizobium sp. STM 3843]